MEKIRALRKQNGLSQEELAEKSGLSLRTIQRIESGETEPRGDSLKRISAALGATPNDIMDWEMEENSHFLSIVNLSSLTFIAFPPLGIIVPYIIGNSRRDTVKNAKHTVKEIVNFQITWNILVFALVPVIPSISSFGFGLRRDDTAHVVIAICLLTVFLFVCNLVVILINQWRIGKGREVRYLPKINFMR